MSLGSLLWVHGKRERLLSFAAQISMASGLHSGVREDRHLVRRFPNIVVNDRNS